MNSLAPTTTNSRYRLLGEVGRGQFGKVFCGCDRLTGQLFALKSLDLLKFPTRSFLKELAVLVQLNHPNVVSFHGVEYSRAGRYIVMDYCECGTLRQLMEAKTEISLAQKLSLVKDILQGLEHVHQHRIIHCDLKPDNILLTVSEGGWRAKIADFGIAHFLEILSTPSSNSASDNGSPAYMAPERFYGHYSPESDLYAVGVLLFELVAGWRPFSGLPMDVMKAHLNQPLRLPKSIPTLLKAIIRKALQKLPQHRYTSAAEMRLMVETVIATLQHANDSSSLTTQADVTVLAMLSREANLEVGPSECYSEVEVPKPTVIAATIRSMQLQPEHLQHRAVLEHVVQRLWPRPQGCFMLAANGELACWQSGTDVKVIGALPIPHPVTGATTLDLNLRGNRLALLSGADGTGASLLQIFNLSELRLLCQRALQETCQHLCWSSPHHILVAHLSAANALQAEAITQLQLWNRRGQFYGSYQLPISLRQAVLSYTTRHRLFAITDEDGFLIDLFPFKIQRVTLPIHPDWIGTTHWGYLLVNAAGYLVCLNRRGRLMAQSKIPLARDETLTTVAITTPNTLWIATQQHNRSQLYTLDLSLHLPRSLLTL